MKKKILITSLLLAFAVEILALIFFVKQDTEDGLDAVLVNEVLQSIQTNWDAVENYEDQTGLEFVVLDLDGAVLYKTGEGLSESINMAVSHRDTIVDVQVEGSVAGKVIIYNDSTQTFETRKQMMIIIISCAILAQCLICSFYVLYLDRVVLKPFQKLKGFAERIAGGNLDVPLEMDRRNLFGAFTESFDIMRSETSASQQAVPLSVHPMCRPMPDLYNPCLKLLCRSPPMRYRYFAYPSGKHRFLSNT